MRSSSEQISSTLQKIDRISSRRLRTNQAMVVKWGWLSPESAMNRMFLRQALAMRREENEAVELLK
jgi:hypothetical protein